MSKELSHQTRAGHIAKLSEETFDLVIIGGGITGAGVARDAAIRGMKVALIEKNDFAFGTSSRSSKLIHGGIRYLENFEFHLVHEALTERQKLFRMAPHLVHPLRFVLPIYEGDRVGMFKMGMGMWAYDALALFDVPELHEHLTAKRLAQRVSSIKTEGLKGGYVYSDAYMDDDRLVMETLRSAHGHGAILANYVNAHGGEMKNNRLTALQCQDLQSGKQISVRARHFISTVGPWTDIVATDLLQKWQNILRPSKGIHLTLPKNRLPIRDAVVMSTRSDKRIIFAIPRHEMVIVGTTDTDFAGDPADAKAQIEDVKYLVSVVDRYFPGAQLSIFDFMASYVGVRPLIDDKSRTESQTSREHVIIGDPRNVTFVAGGKYTTYRHMAQQTVEFALKSFSVEERIRWNRSHTEDALNPLASEENLQRARQYVERWSRESGLVQSEMAFLVERHGMEAENIVFRRGARGLHLWQLEALHAVHNTMCMKLLDFFQRRSPLMLAERDHGSKWLDSVAQIFAEELNWTSEKTEEEKKSVQKFISSEFDWKNQI